MASLPTLRKPPSPLVGVPRPQTRGEPPTLRFPLADLDQLALDQLASLAEEIDDLETAG